MIRRGEDIPAELLCVTNVTDQRVVVPEVRGTDLLTRLPCSPLSLAPYEYAWVRAQQPPARGEGDLPA